MESAASSSGPIWPGGNPMRLRWQQHLRTLHCTGVTFSAEQMTCGVTKPAATAAGDEDEQVMVSPQAARRAAAAWARGGPPTRPLPASPRSSGTGPRGAGRPPRSRAPATLTPALLVERRQLQQLLQQGPQLRQLLQRRQPWKQRCAAPLDHLCARDEPHRLFSAWMACRHGCRGRNWAPMPQGRRRLCLRSWRLGSPCTAQAGDRPAAWPGGPHAFDRSCTSPHGTQGRLLGRTELPGSAHPRAALPHSAVKKWSDRDQAN